MINARASSARYVVADDQRLQIGLVSDSHDCLPRIDEVVVRLNGEPVELVLHAGDYSAPFVPPHYSALKARLIGVYGNNDAEKAKLQSRFAEAGHEIRGRFAEVQAGKLKIALVHGDEEDLVRSLTTCGAYDVVVYGHTHSAGVAESGRTLVINPGEICGYLTGKSTFAILETTTRTVRLIQFWNA